MLIDLPLHHLFDIGSIDTYAGRVSANQHFCISIQKVVKPLGFSSRFQVGQKQIDNLSSQIFRK